MLAALNGHVEVPFPLFLCPYVACRMRSAQVLRLLVARRANLQARANDGLTPPGAQEEAFMAPFARASRRF